MITRRLSLIVSVAVLLVGCRQADQREINLFMGTSGDNGQVSPGAAVPKVPPLTASASAGSRTVAERRSVEPTRSSAMSGDDAGTMPFTNQALP